MSTLGYALLTAQREVNPPRVDRGRTADDAGTPAASVTTAGRRDGAASGPRRTSGQGLAAYVDTMAALVPAEVLALHAVMLTVTTATRPEGGAPAGAAAGTVTTITDPGALYVTFWVLAALSALLYVAGHLAERGPRWEWADWGRMLLPSLAFAAWTMLQRATAFDAVAPRIDAGYRNLLGLALAVVVSAAAPLLAKVADDHDDRQNSADKAGGPATGGAPAAR